MWTRVVNSFVAQARLSFSAAEYVETSRTGPAIQLFDGTYAGKGL
jgi:hypothetical protein